MRTFSLSSPSPTQRLLGSVQLIHQGTEAKVYKVYLRDSEWRQKAKHADHDTCSMAEDMAPNGGCVGPGVVDGKSVRVLLPGGSEVMVAQDSDATDGVGPDRCEDAALAEFGVERDDLLNMISIEIAKMHIVNIIHGDLTTLNMILCGGTRTWSVLIDFGLAYHSSLVEDKAVDLYVLERAFASTHPDAEPLFNSVLASYEKHLGKHWSVIKKQLDDVRLRGRKCST
ncbi:hypothetical protein BKA82DRAFT_4167556, partial [Pisolithus tinctorius]